MTVINMDAYQLCHWWASKKRNQKRTLEGSKLETTQNTNIILTVFLYFFVYWQCFKLFHWCFWDIY